MRYHLTPVRMAIINKSQASAGEDVEKGEPFCTAGGNADWCSPRGKQYGGTSLISYRENIVQCGLSL